MKHRKKQTKKMRKAGVSEAGVHIKMYRTAANAVAHQFQHVIFAGILRSPCTEFVQNTQ